MLLQPVHLRTTRTPRCLFLKIQQSASLTQETPSNHRQLLQGGNLHSSHRSKSSGAKLRVTPVSSSDSRANSQGHMEACQDCRMMNPQMNSKVTCYLHQAYLIRHPPLSRIIQLLSKCQQNKRVKAPLRRVR